MQELNTLHFVKSSFLFHWVDSVNVKKNTNKKLKGNKILATTTEENNSNTEIL